MTFLSGRIARAMVSSALALSDVTVLLLCLSNFMLIDNKDQWGLGEVVIAIGSILRTHI